MLGTRSPGFCGVLSGMTQRQKVAFALILIGLVLAFLIASLVVTMFQGSDAATANIILQDFAHKVSYGLPYCFVVFFVFYFWVLCLFS